MCEVYYFVFCFFKLLSETYIFIFIEVGSVGEEKLCIFFVAFSFGFGTERVFFNIYINIVEDEIKVWFSV